MVYVDIPVSLFIILFVAMIFFFNFHSDLFYSQLSTSRMFYSEFRIMKFATYACCLLLQGRRTGSTSLHISG
jgi:hypothetical protein